MLECARFSEFEHVGTSRFAYGLFQNLKNVSVDDNRLLLFRT